jgi:hypothetical protein
VRDRAADRRADPARRRPRHAATLARLGLAPHPPHPRLRRVRPARRELLAHAGLSDADIP